MTDQPLTDERQSWLLLASLFGDPSRMLQREDSEIIDILYDATTKFSCLCYAIQALLVQREIGYAVSEKMTNKIMRDLNMREHTFLYPRTIEGHLKRAAYCRGKAESCR